MIPLPEKKVSIELTLSEALVLLAWISRIDSSGSIPADESAEQAVLWSVEARLEGALRSEPLGSDWAGLVAAARDRVRELARGEDLP
jgi:hypothetical protein